jgi:hypothetical protein
MKKYGMILGILIVVSVIFAADKSFEERGLEIKNAIVELPVKRKQLDVIEYSGTITEVMEARVKDVNEVYQHAVKIRKDTEKLCEDANLPFRDTKKLMKWLERKTAPDPNAIKKRKINADFMKIVLESASDPNMYPEIDDPNYITKVEDWERLLLAVAVICEPI